MRVAGMADTNPGHPTLLALLEAGATEDEFIGAARTAVRAKKSFAYALATLTSQRKEAKELNLQPAPSSASKADAVKQMLRGNTNSAETVDV